MLVEEADVAERNFIITGDDADLLPFDAELREAPLAYERLRQLLLESPNELKRLTELETAIASQLSGLGQTITLRKQQGFGAARDVIAAGTSKASMDSVRDKVSALVAAERDLLNRRQEVGRQRERDILLIGIFIAALSVTIRIAVAVVVARLRKRGLTKGSSAKQPSV